MDARALAGVDRRRDRPRHRAGARRARHQRRLRPGALRRRGAGRGARDGQLRRQAGAGRPRRRSPRPAPGGPARPRRRGRRRRPLRDRRERPTPAAVEAAQSADYVTFTSSSTVQRLTEALGDGFPAGARIVSIGPITSEAARDAGLEVASKQTATTSTACSKPCSPTPPADRMTCRLCRTATSAWTDSTNTRARELAEAGAPHGTVVTAGEQTRGARSSGRSGRRRPARRCSTRRSCGRSTRATCCCRSPSRWPSATPPRRSSPASSAGSSGRTTSGSRDASWPGS